MALLALPVELIDACLSPLTLNHRALAAVARTSRLLNTCATRILYRHLSLSAYAKNLPLISLLSTHPHLAAHVRTFSVYLDDADPAVVPTYSDLQRALGLMTNLMSLALYVDASASWILSPPQGENSQKSDGIPSSGPAFYPRLEHLTCNFPFDAHLASFLAQTPSLISLTLSSILSDSELESDPQDLPTPKCHIHIPTSHIPLLEGYTGPADLFPTLLSRPLRAVHLSGDLALDFLSVTGAPSAGGAVPPLRARDDVVTHQSRGGSIPAAGGAALQVMSAMTSEPPAELLDALALAFPNLVCLRVMTTHAMWDLPDLSFYSHIAATLSTLPRLSAFELAGIHWQYRPKPSSSPYTSDKEWLSPSVVPRGFEPLPDGDELAEADGDYEFDGGFYEWSH